ERDKKIEKFHSEKNIGFHTFKDQVIFEKDEIVKDNGDPYIVYTPYMKTWKAKFKKEYEEKSYCTIEFLDNLYQNSQLPNLSLSDIGFEKSKVEVPDFDVSPTTIQDYEKKRNFPAEDGTSRLGAHLRYGTVSIRKMMKKATTENNETFWQELIWREFFMQILWRFPETVENA